MNWSRDQRSKAYAKREILFLECRLDNAWRTRGGRHSFHETEDKLSRIIIAGKIGEKKKRRRSFRDKFGNEAVLEGKGKYDNFLIVNLEPC